MRIPVTVYEEIKPEDILALSEPEDVLSDGELMSIVTSSSSVKRECAYKWFEGIPYQVTVIGDEDERTY